MNSGNNLFDSNFISNGLMSLTTTEPRVHNGEIIFFDCEICQMGNAGYLQPFILKWDTQFLTQNST